MPLSLTMPSFGEAGGPEYRSAPSGIAGHIPYKNQRITAKTAGNV